MLFVGPHLVVMLRDDLPDIPFPNCWDFPGGARDGQETPEECVLRETHEEVGITLRKQDLVWARSFAATRDRTWMFAAHLPAKVAGQLQLGSEGQALRLMTPDDYVGVPNHIPHFAQRLQLYLSEVSGLS